MEDGAKLVQYFIGTVESLTQIRNDVDDNAITSALERVFDVLSGARQLESLDDIARLVSKKFQLFFTLLHIF